MSIFTKALAGAGAGALLVAAPAAADQPADPSGERAHIVIDQIQTGDLWSDMNVHVETGATDASSSATTVGNTGAGLLMSGAVDYDANQEMHGDAEAHAELTGGVVSGTAITAATAYGNASNAGTWMGDSYVQSYQTMNGDTTASTTFDLDGANVASGATTAIANVATTSGEFGDNRAYQEQASNGSVTATTDADLCCNGTQAGFATTAGGNAITSTGYTTTAIQGAVQTTAAGERLQAVTDVYIGDAHNAVAATTASGNAYVLNNQFGYTSHGREGSELFQGNESEIDAQTYVTLTNFGGHAAASSYGVGNSAVVSNVGSDTALNAIQSNFANVSSQASFTGQSMTGGVATLSSVSIGNAATASLCNTCGDATLNGRTQQFNSANISASATMNVPGAGAVIGSASAIGNASTYQSGGH